MQMQVSHQTLGLDNTNNTDLSPSMTFGTSSSLENNPNVASFLACQNHDDIEELMGRMTAETTAAGQVTAALQADNPADYMVLMAGVVSCLEGHIREHEREIGVLQSISANTGERLTDAEDRILSEEGNVRGLRQAIMAMQNRFDTLEAEFHAQASELQELRQRGQVDRVAIQALARLANVDYNQVSAPNQSAVQD